MKDPFPTQGRYRGRLEDALAAREERRIAHRERMTEGNQLSEDIIRKLRLMDKGRLRGFPIRTKGVGGAMKDTYPDSCIYKDER